jgi:hypothetical protein
VPKPTPYRGTIGHSLNCGKGRSITSFRRFFCFPELAAILIAEAGKEAAMFL